MSCPVRSADPYGVDSKFAAGVGQPAPPASARCDAPDSVQRRNDLAGADDPEAARYVAKEGDITLVGRLESLRATIEAIPLSVVIIRADGRIVVINAEAERLFGYARGELLGQPIEVLVPARFRGEHPSHRQRFLAEPSARRMGAGLDLQGLRKDGREFSVEIGLIPIRTDDGIYVLSVVVDITERRRRDQWFRAMVETAPIAMAMVDRNGRIAQINPQTEALFEYSRDELLGSEIELLIPERFHPEHPKLRAEYQDNPSARPMGLGRTVHGRRKNGSEMELEVSLSPVASDSTDHWVLVMAVDVTFQRQRERERERNAAELARINRSLDEFAFMASHDLQEPLRKVASCCQVLNEDYADKLDDTGREWLGFAVDGARRIQLMVADLLTFSRLGRKEEDFGPVNVAAACRAAVENLQVAIEESGAQLTCGPLPTVSASMTQLIQLFQNLIGNAIKYRGDRTPEIVIGAERQDAWWRFFVRDNGIGIAPEFHERVFTIFQRLHKKEDYGGGTGIGLAIVKKIVDQLGGRIWIESAVGEGSTFYFTLPCASDKSNSREQHVHVATH